MNPKGKTQKKKSINSSYKYSMLILAIIIGLGLISFEVTYETIASKIRLETEVSKYENKIRERIKEEVENAVIIANILYLENSAKGESKEDIKKQTMSLLEHLGSEDVGYFFAADYSGNEMLGPSKGKNVYEFEDNNGLKVIQELIKTAKSGGGYLEYVIPSLEGTGPMPKVSYVLPFEPFNCYIGAGVNLEEIDAIINQIENETLQKNIQTIIISCILVIILVLIFIRVNSILYRRIEHETNMIKSFLERSEQENAVLNLDLMSFLELHQIGSYTINLIEKRNEDQTVLSEQYNMIKDTARKLEKTNKSLEEEIRKRTVAFSLLDESKKRMELIIRTIPDIIFIMNQYGDILDCEMGAMRWQGKCKEELLDMNILEIIPANIAKACIERIRKSLDTNEIQTYEFGLGTTNTMEYYESRIISIQKGQVFNIIRNVTEIKKIHMRNEYLSYRDQLTGAYNRRYFEEELECLDIEQNLPMALVMVDVNGLKLTNDAFGHRTGDRLLCLVSDILRKHFVLPRSFVARIGGDEFVMVCPNTTQASIENMIGKIYQSISSQRNHQPILSISMGWELKTRAEQKITDVFNKAEEHMYRKKLTESQSIRNATVQAIVKTLNEKNVREKIHSERVGTISKLIGEAMNLDYVTVKEIETAGLLHDIGKISVEENILNKDGTLSEDEYEKIKKHPESSYQILQSINAYAGLAEDVLSHHERWDGEGYPRGLKGEEISLIARIITVADAYEAMTADRAYRTAMPKVQAMDELRKFAGTQFDKGIVDIFEQKVINQL